MAESTHQPAAVLAREVVTRLAGLPERSVPTVRRARRGISKEVRDWPGDAVLRLARALLRDPTRAPRWLVYEIISAHPGALRALTTRTVRAFGRGMDSWGEIDVFGCYVAGPA